VTQINARTHTRIDEIPAEAWNRLDLCGNPFVRHEFLLALEQHGCVGGCTGWTPYHLALREGEHLVAAVPMYIKSDSFGEFVFDWSWAEAYHLHGEPYYPKLVIAVPYTPVGGPRILLDPELEHPEAVKRLALQTAIDVARKLDVSSLHLLFCDRGTADIGEELGMLCRTGCQYHWHNRDYRDFEHYLGHFSSKNRKKVRYERRAIDKQSLKFEWIRGDKATQETWQWFYRFYSRTFRLKSGYVPFTRPFFEQLSATMGDQLALLLVSSEGSPIAGAIDFAGVDALFGRYWGCTEERRFLHFETCYYQGIQYCIEHGLQRYEPGAQGEFKIKRGFDPVLTWSLHWIAHPGFRPAIEHFIKQEDRIVRQRKDYLTQRLPFKHVP